MEFYSGSNDDLSKVSLSSRFVIIVISLTELFGKLPVHWFGKYLK